MLLWHYPLRVSAPMLLWHYPLRVSDPVTPNDPVIRADPVTVNPIVAVTEVRVALEPDTMTFFQFGILYLNYVAVRYIH
jgi:hypothetical protein